MKTTDQPRIGHGIHPPKNPAFRNDPTTNPQRSETIRPDPKTVPSVPLYKSGTRNGEDHT